jgi:hypothetical protein
MHLPSREALLIFLVCAVKNFQSKVFHIGCSREIISDGIVLRELRFSLRTKQNFSINNHTTMNCLISPLRADQNTKGDINEREEKKKRKKTCGVPDTYLF